jgi:hypothetical protein
MLYNRYYDVDSLTPGESILDNIDLFFMGNSNEIRATKIPSVLEERFNGRAFSINYDIENEKYTLQESSLNIKKREENLEEVGKNLIVSFIEELESININDKVILIDITSLKHPIVFYFILVLKKNFKPKNVFITYTEPQKYIKNSDEVIKDKFDLTEKFCEVNSLPGFLRISDYKKEKVLVAVMGFEGNRFSKAFNDINPANMKTHAVVGFPSFHPSWQYYVYSQNENALTQSRGYALMHRTTANEPFGVFNILTDIKKNNPNYEIFVAPIGTKPHSLGVSMFAIINEDVQLYYDFPAHGNKLRTIGVGKSYLYNLTDFINEK